MEINGTYLGTGYYYIIQGRLLFSNFLFCGANCVLCSVFCGSAMFLGNFYLSGVWKTDFFSTAGVRSLFKVQESNYYSKPK